MPKLNPITFLYEPDQETEYEEPQTQEKVETSIGATHKNSMESVSTQQTPIFIQQTQKSTKEKIKALYEQLLSNLMWKTVVAKGEGSTSLSHCP